MFRNRVSLILFLAFLVSLSAIIFIINFTAKSKPVVGPPPREEIITPSPQTVEVSLKSTEPVWQVGKTYSVDVSFSKDPPIEPVAYSVNLSYNPKVLGVKSISIGDVWQKYNVLEKKTDKEKGMVTLTVGKGFGESFVNYGTLASIDFAVRSASETVVLEMLDESAIALNGKGLPITAEPLSIVISK